MEQLGNLLTAMIAVIVSGNAGILLDSPTYSRHSELEGIDLREFRRGGKYFGTYARVSRDLGVSRPSVCRVVQGYASRRILDAVLREIRRIDEHGWQNYRRLSLLWNWASSAAAVNTVASIRALRKT